MNKHEINVSILDIDEATSAVEGQNNNTKKFLVDQNLFILDKSDKKKSVIAPKTNNFHYNKNNFKTQKSLNELTGRTFTKIDTDKMLASPKSTILKMNVPINQTKPKVIKTLDDILNSVKKNNPYLNKFHETPQKKLSETKVLPISYYDYLENFSSSKESISKESASKNDIKKVPPRRESKEDVNSLKRQITSHKIIKQIETKIHTSTRNFSKKSLPKKVTPIEISQENVHLNYYEYPISEFNSKKNSVSRMISPAFKTSSPKFYHSNFKYNQIRSSKFMGHAEKCNYNHEFKKQ